MNILSTKTKKKITVEIEVDGNEHVYLLSPGVEIRSELNDAISEFFEKRGLKNTQLSVVM